MSGEHNLSQKWFWWWVVTSLATAEISIFIFSLKWKIILFVSSGAVRLLLPGECGAAICANHSHVITLVDEILPLSQFLNLTSLQVIRRDIARTYPEHEFFKKKDGVGQESLFNVMKAYSVHDRKWFKYHWHWYASKLNFTLYPFWKLNHPFVKYIKTQPKCSKYFALKWNLSCACREVGYCQGSAFIVGLLLMQVV